MFWNSAAAFLRFALASMSSIAWISVPSARGTSRIGLGSS